MSLEPQTTAKVRINTTKGTLIVELWAKETPNTSRLFLEKALNQTFNGFSFNRVIPNFLIQTANSDLQSQEIKIVNEYHPRIKFNRRGLLGSVNEDHSQFFITLDQTPELNNKNTLFGKIVDDSIFTALKIAEAEIEDETPLYPTRIISSEVLVPYFDDLKLDEKENYSVETKKSKTDKKKRKINIKLTLFDEVNNEDEGDTGIVPIKMKSAVSSKPKSKKQKIISSNNEISHNNYEPLIESEDALNNNQIENTKNETDDTIEILKRFEKNLKSKSKYSQQLDTNNFSHKRPHTFNETRDNLSDHDSDFDNLTESDDDDDLFSHELKFTEELIEDDLVTIDTKNL